MEGSDTERCLNENIDSGVVNENIDAELTGIIYEAALDPHLWPDLLEVLSLMLKHPDTVNHGKDIEHGNTEENDRFFRLLPHFHRALAINRRINDTNQEHHFTNSIIDQFPIGVIVINAERKIILSNQRANEVIHRQLGLSIVNNKFCIDDKEKNEMLNKYIEHLTTKEIGDKINNTYSLAINQQDQSTLSLLISTELYCRYHYDYSAERRVTLFIASPCSRQAVSHDALQSLFHLTPTEARLTASLANGITIDESARINHVSIHTARTHVKKIFQKTGTHRQTELIQLILTSPAVLTAPDEQQYSLKKDRTHLALKYQFNEALLTLADGRQLSFCEYGDASGIPIFFFHGILGSRYERNPDDSIIKGLGIRLIVPDRPGYGHSDFNHDGSHLEFANDINQLANHLGIIRFSVLGLSVGAIYAAACAYKMPQKISSATLVGMTLPLHTLSDVSDLLPSYKLQFAITRFLPGIARLFPEFAIKNACANPEKFFKNMPLNQVDRDIFFRESLHDHLVNSLLSGSRESHRGFVADLMSSIKPWSFPIENIKTKINIWHGSDDLHSPIRRIHELVERIPHARFSPINSAGHFFIYDYWEDIMKTIKNNL